MMYFTKVAFICLASFASMSIFSQTDAEAEIATATITEEFCVTLDAAEPIAEFYVIDISHLELISEKEANDRFGYISNNFLTYTVDFEAHEAQLQIHLDRTPMPHDIIWWNDYLESLCGL